MYYANAYIVAFFFIKKTLGHFFWVDATSYMYYYKGQFLPTVLHTTFRHLYCKKGVRNPAASRKLVSLWGKHALLGVQVSLPFQLQAKTYTQFCRRFSTGKTHTYHLLKGIDLSKKTSTVEHKEGETSDTKFFKHVATKNTTTYRTKKRWRRYYNVEWFCTRGDMVAFF